MPRRVCGRDAALEALMSSLAYISAHLEMENIMANMFASCSGFRLPFEITGECPATIKMDPRIA
jgi:hypothetical protein